jgi:hypothetical protein
MAWWVIFANSMNLVVFRGPSEELYEIHGSGRLTHVLINLELVKLELFGLKN